MVPVQPFPDRMKFPVIDGVTVIPAPLLFNRVTICEPLPWPTGREPNAIVVLLSVIGPATPVPDRFTVPTGVPFELTVRVPINAPTEAGLNRTQIVQLALFSNDTGQLLPEIENCPLMAAVIETGKPVWF